MNERELAGPWIRRFLLEHVVAERNLARNTQKSYRDTMILLLPFVAGKAKRALDRLALEDFTPDAIRRFLNSLEKDRGSSVATRNQRLATVHAWTRFVAEHLPEQVVWSSQVRAIPFKKGPRSVVAYLEKAEMDALLDTPDHGTPQGNRDYAMLLTLYNSGARASEIAQATVGDLDLGRSPSIRIQGKGNKTRLCPLWGKTVDILMPLVAGRGGAEPVFLNRSKQPFTRFGVLAMVKRYANQAASKVPSLAKKKVGAHTIRHTTAVHLLRAGVDLNTIRAWLGHVSLNTTNIYAEIDLEMKAKALEHCEPEAAKVRKRWREDPGVIAFLRGL
jgi:site-specific recombinase XerD